MSQQVSCEFASVIISKLLTKTALFLDSYSVLKCGAGEGRRRSVVAIV